MFMIINYDYWCAMTSERENIFIRIQNIHLIKVRYDAIQTNIE